MARKPKNQQGTSRLLDLPAELRVIIYEFYLTNILNHKNFLLRKRSLKKFRSHLLNTCKLIRQEALPIYAEELTQALSKLEERKNKAKEAERLGPSRDFDLFMRRIAAERVHSMVSGIVKEERNKIAAVEKQRTGTA